MRRRSSIFGLWSFVIWSLVSAGLALGQEKPPAPGAAKSVKIPPVSERRLANGLTVASVEKHNLPLVTVQLLIKAGANSEGDDQAGFADMTASMLTKGTKTRTATQIAEAVESLGGSINSGAGWNSSFVALTVTSDKLDAAMAILADVILHPKFDQKELDLLKSQSLDGLTYNLKQPSFLANYVASKYSFGEHPAGGTPDSIGRISRANVVQFYNDIFQPDNAVLIFSGDVTPARAGALSQKSFGSWGSPKVKNVLLGAPTSVPENQKPSTEKRNQILVIDLPKSGQAAVTYAKPVAAIGRSSSSYYPAIVLNSVLGGGYSSRLNYEIRIKRGLSYGAGSGFGWRADKATFATRVQTKNQSAAEVAELTLNELKRLSNNKVDPDELVPRKSVLTGGFGRNLETTGGLASAIGDLYAFGMSTSELNAYMGRVNGVSADQIKEFAVQNLKDGDLIIVGDYSVFKDDLVKRFSKNKITVIEADQLDIGKPDLHK
ncbi:MAG: insulinase family protein [Acidobacteria bacterium]|nr:insulinase family protein [Acidobacteriota bacterium]